MTRVRGRGRREDRLTTPGGGSLGALNVKQGLIKCEAAEIADGHDSGRASKSRQKPWALFHRLGASRTLVLKDRDK